MLKTSQWKLSPSSWNVTEFISELQIPFKLLHNIIQVACGGFYQLFTQWIWSVWTPCCAHTYPLWLLHPRAFFLSIFLSFSFWFWVSLSFTEFPAPSQAPCCDPLLNILYNLNLPAVYSTDYWSTTSWIHWDLCLLYGYTSMSGISYECVWHWSMCLWFVSCVSTED